MTAIRYHLAQANLSRLRYPPDSPQVGEFIAALDRINRLAGRSPGSSGVTPLTTVTSAWPAPRDFQKPAS